jgi:hypothetical protein
MTNFDLQFSQLEAYAKKRRHLAAWSEALDKIKAAFPECDDTYDIHFMGGLDIAHRPATYVPYGETSVPLHEAYNEVDSVDIEAIYWSDNDREDHLEITLINKDVLSSLEDLIASYLEDHQDEWED